MTVKLLGASTYYEQLKNCYMVAQGWQETDFTFLYGASVSETEKIANETERRHKSRCKNALKELCSDQGIKAGDIILAYKGAVCMQICEVPQDFTFVYWKQDLQGKKIKDYGNGLFPVKWVDWSEVSSTYFPPNTADAYGVYGIKSWQNVNPWKEQDAQEVTARWVQYKKANNFDPNNFPPEIMTRFIEEKSSFEQRKKDSYEKFERRQPMVQETVNLLKNVYNLVLTGAPGTGKTYLAKLIAEELTKDNKLPPEQITLDCVLKAFDDNMKIINKSEVQAILDTWADYAKKIKDGTLTLTEYANLKHTGESLAHFVEHTTTEFFGKTSFYGAKKFGIYTPGTPEKGFPYKNSEDKNLNDKEAEKLFREKILPFWQDILGKKSAEEMLKEIDKLETEKTAIIPLYQVMRKMVVLQFPTELVGIYDTRMLDKFLTLLGKPELGKSDTFYEKNRALVTSLQELRPQADIKQPTVLCAWEAALCRPKFFTITQFHPSYDYTDFVEGLRPCYKSGSKEISFELKQGIFMKFCEKAAKDVQRAEQENKATQAPKKKEPNKYVFIIDEINRGEISKIFGELFAAIEPGYRGRKDFGIQTQYHNLHEGCEDFKGSAFMGGFYVPENVYIIGTMNDIDHSVESLDFALRRRFTWKPITAAERAEAILYESLPNRDFREKVINRMNNLNAAIEKIEGFSDIYHIGPAYFAKLKDYDGKEKFDKLWNYHLAPLLKEYLRDRPAGEVEEAWKALKAAYEDETKHSDYTEQK